MYVIVEAEMLKKLIAYSLPIIFLVPTEAFAESSNKPTWMEYCKSLSDVASAIMDARQSGVSMSKVMDLPAEGLDGKLTRMLVMNAYEQPHFTSKEYQQRAVVDFGNSTYLACARAKSK